MWKNFCKDRIFLCLIMCPLAVFFAFDAILTLYCSWLYIFFFPLRRKEIFLSHNFSFILQRVFSVFRYS